MKRRSATVRGLLNISCAMGFISVLTGCATTPVPVRILTMKPSGNSAVTQAKPPVVLAVTDRRSAASKEPNIIGLKRNWYWAPMAVVFLAHGENLDKVLVRRLEPLLREAGYEVVGTVPDVSGDPPPDLSDQEVKKKKEKTTGVSNGRTIDKADVKKAQEVENDAVVADVGIKSIDGITVVPAYEGKAIIEVRIRSFYTDIVPFSGIFWPFVQSWTIYDVYVYGAGEGPRELTWGKKVFSYSSVAWAPVDFGGETSYNLSVNSAFRFSARKIEKMLAEPGFYEAVERAARKN